MSIKNLEIKPSEAKAVEIASLPTRPTSSATYGGRGLTAQEMKKAYDAYPALIKERFNALIADLLSGIAINDIPFSIPSHEPFGENIEQTVKGFLDAVGAILDFGTDDARTIFGFVKQFVSDVAMATSLEYDKSTQLLKLTIDGEEKSVTIDFSQFDQFETAIAELRSTVQTLDATKFDKSGGGITGDVNIGGSVYIGKDLTIAGNSIIQEAEHLQVKDAVIVMNKDGEILTVPAGSVIRKGVNANGVDETYGIMYDPVSDSVKLGLIYQDENGNYQFLAGEGYPVATRADSSVMQDGMFAVWDAANRRFVTSNVSSSDVNSKLDAVSTNNIIYATDAYGGQTNITYAKGSPAADNVPVMDDQARLFAVTTGEEPMDTPLSNFVLANRYYVDSADNKIKDTVSKQAADIDLLYTLIENTIITLTEVEDTYTTRETAGGLPVVDNSPTTVHRIAGDTKTSENMIDESLLLPLAFSTTKIVEKQIAFTISAGTYTVSNIVEGGKILSNVFGIYLIDSSNKVILSCNAAGNSATNCASTFTVTEELAQKTEYLRIHLNPVDAEYNIEHFMLNKGSEALPYSDYFAGTKSAAFQGIVSYGRNLLKPSADLTKTIAGVTYRAMQETGTVKVTGTPNAREGTAVFKNIPLPAGTFTMYIPNKMSGVSWYLRNSTTQVASIGASTTNQFVTFTADTKELYSIYVYVEVSVGTIDYTETPMLLYGSVTENFPAFSLYSADGSFHLDTAQFLGKWDYIDADTQALVTATADADFSSVTDADGVSASGADGTTTAGRYYWALCSEGMVADDFTLSDIITNLPTIEDYQSLAPDGNAYLSLDTATRTLILLIPESYGENGGTWVSEQSDIYALYKTSAPNTATISCPKTYKVWRNGTETLDTGDTEAVLPTVTQTYYEEVTSA